MNGARWASIVIQASKLGSFVASCAALTLVGLMTAGPARADLIDPQLTINPGAACGGAVTCNGGVPFSLTSSNLGSAGLPTFGGTPVQFAITNNTGTTLTSVSLTLSGTLGANPEGWNSGTSGFNSSTNPFTLATIDGFDSLTGTPCTGGGVSLGSASTGTCAGGALPATFVWSLGTGVGWAPGTTLLLEYNSPVIGDSFTPAPVPEPSSLLLAGTGLAALGAWTRRRLFSSERTV